MPNCKKSERNLQEGKLLLATKTVSAANIKIALEAGETLLGKNKEETVESNGPGK